MDKRVILAAAGSGKTNHIVDSLSASDRSLVITYTINNYNNLRTRIAKEYGYIPEHIRVYKYFSFLYSFCLRPFAADKTGLQGINWHDPPKGVKKVNSNYYMDKTNRAYHNRMAVLPEFLSIVPSIRSRVCKYFDSVFVDEVQDFASHDFNFLCSMLAANVNSELIGDFYQHTYATSRDGRTNCNLHKEIAGYRDKFRQHGFELDDTSFIKSHRCSPTVCDFVSKEIGVQIESHRKDETKLEFVDTEERADELFHQKGLVKLFYEMHEKYPCFSDNWGASKGLDDFDSVCVVLTNTAEQLYKKGQLGDLPPMSRNKLYVACTRCRSNLYLVPQRFYQKYRI